MGLPTAFVEQLWESRTPIVLLAFVVIAALAARDPRIERYHIKMPTTMLVCHLIALLVVAAQHDHGYDAQIAEVTSLAFELLAIVSLGMTAVFRMLLPRLGLSLPRIMIDLLTGVAVIVAFIVVGQRAGFSVAGLITTSAVLTAVIGFSLQDTLGNVMGGLALQLDKSVSVGDWITLGQGQPSGRVIEIRWRYTAIETRNWETIIIPNSMLIKSQVMILGRRVGAPALWRRTVEFFVDFRTSPTDVIAAVSEAFENPVPRVAPEPAPQVLFFGVRDSYGVYCVRYWLSDLASDDGGDSAVRVRVWFALQRAGIPLAMPASAVFLTHDTPERAERKADRDRAQRLRALAAVDLFSALPDAQRDELAGNLDVMRFAAGEAVTREGDDAEGLYILIEGEAHVRIGIGREARGVATLGPGQFFGEMSLMTGEARTASVIAATDLLTYRIDKPAFEAILRETPSLADQIAEILVARKSELTAVRDERDELTRSRIEHAKQDLVGKIRRFFALDRR